MAAQREPDNDKMWPEADWEPKSPFFRSLWKEIYFRRTHTQISLECPHCHHFVKMDISFPGDQPKT